MRQVRTRLFEEAKQVGLTDMHSVLVTRKDTSIKGKLINDLVPCSLP